MQEDDSMFGPLSLDHSLPYPCGFSTATITGLPVDSQWKVKLWLENDAGVGTMSEYVTFSKWIHIAFTYTYICVCVCACL